MPALPKKMTTTSHGASREVVLRFWEASCVVAFDGLNGLQTIAKRGPYLGKFALELLPLKKLDHFVPDGEKMARSSC